MMKTMLLYTNEGMFDYVCCSQQKWRSEGFDF